MLTENTAPGNADFDWRTFLLRWSGEWADALPDDEVRDADDEAARQSRWLGLPPASEERIAAMEKRLGRRMPPSYRNDFRVIDRSQPYPRAVEMVRSDLDARIRERLREVLLEAGKDPDAREALLRFFRTTRFLPIDHATDAALQQLGHGVARVRAEVE